MELLVSFTEEEVFTATAPSNWVEVSLPRPPKPTPQHHHCSHSCSRSCQACPRGSLSVAHGIDQSITTEETDVPAASSQERALLQSYCRPPALHQVGRNHLHPVGRGEKSNHSNQDPPEELKELLEVMGFSIMAICLIWHPISGEMYIDMLTCMLSIVNLGFNTHGR